MSTRNVLAGLTAVAALGGAYFLWTPGLPPLSTEQYIELGEEKARGNDAPGAVRYFTAALDADPRNVRALHGRAVAHSLSDRTDLAFADLENAIHFSHRTHGKSLLARALLLHSVGEYEQALADANRAIELNGEHAEAHLIRALIYRHPQKGNADRSRADYQRALALAPELKDRAQALGF